MSGLQGIGKSALRVAKNYTKGYSDTQSKVRDATSNDPWGPSGTQMNEIAQMTYNQNDFVEIMEMLDKRLNDKGKNWRHVFKCLTVLDYCLHAGSENVVIYFRDNLYVIKTLREFQYVDEEGKDQGANVRQKAKDIVNLLQDEARLRHERKSRASMRDRMLSGHNNYDEDAGGADNENARRRSQSVPPARKRGEDDQLRRAIEESKRLAEQEAARNGIKTAEERDLEKAIRLSKEDEDKRNKAVEDANANSLFDDNNPTSPQQGFGLIDPSAYATGLQPQFTAIQPQFTAFNPYQQQMQQEAIQQEYLRQQQEWMMQQQQQQEMLAQQQAQAQHQAQQQQEEWMRQQMLLQQQQQQQQYAQMQAQQQQQLMPQPTGFGSNNPFAPAQPQAQSPMPPMPQNNNYPSFNLQGTYSNGPAPSLAVSPPPQPVPGPASAPAQQRGPTRADQEHSHLANLLANRDDSGIDTFGNFGALRYGQNAGRIVGQQTGAPGAHNPFARQQQQQQQQQGDQPFFSI